MPRGQTIREEYIRNISAPIAVHDDEGIKLFHLQTDTVKLAWNRFAQDAADKFTEEECDSYDTAASYYKWSPCTFTYRLDTFVR